MAALIRISYFPFRRNIRCEVFSWKWQFDPLLCNRHFFRGTRRNTEVLSDTDNQSFSIENAVSRSRNSVPDQSVHSREISEQQLHQNFPSENEDFFGIESDVGVTNVIQNSNSVSPQKKYNYLLRSRKSKVNDEKVIMASYGIIRYDGDNRPVYHGQYDDDILKKNSIFFTDETSNEVMKSEDVAASEGDCELETKSDSFPDVQNEDLPDVINPLLTGADSLNTSELKSNTFSETERKSIYNVNIATTKKEPQAKVLHAELGEASIHDNRCSESVLKEEFINYGKNPLEWSYSLESNENQFSSDFNMVEEQPSDNTGPPFNKAVVSNVDLSFTDSQYSNSLLRGNSQSGTIASQQFPSKNFIQIESNKTESNFKTNGMHEGLSDVSIYKQHSLSHGYSTQSTNSEELSEIDKQYFGQSMECENSSLPSSAAPLLSESEELSEIDKQYFGQSMKYKNPCLQSISTPYNESNEFSEIDSQYFGKSATYENMVDKLKNNSVVEVENLNCRETEVTNTSSKFTYSKLPPNFDVMHGENFHKDFKNTLTHNLKGSEIHSVANKVQNNAKQMKGNAEIHRTSLNDNQVVEEIIFNYKENEIIDEHHGFKTKRMSKAQIKPCIEDPKTAFDYVMKVRKEKSLIKEKPSAKDIPLSSKENDFSSGISKSNVFISKNEHLDSRGYKNLKNQVLDLQTLPKDALLHLLRDSVLYNDCDIVAIDKPYGLISQGGSDKSGVVLQHLLPDLAKLLDKTSSDPKLYTVHRLDRNTTGVMLLAKTLLMQSHLNSLFSQRKITKLYWVLTNGIPNPKEGIIDIPLDEGHINGKVRMVLRPEATKETKSVCRNSKTAQRAVTHYRVLSENANVALVEVRPETGCKHQIRVHLGFGLRCPILGDHKYSYLDKLIPQKLFGETLLKLGVRQSKVRHIPMHIYARTVVIPEVLSGRNLFIHAHMPSHFIQNMKSLGIKKP